MIIITLVTNCLRICVMSMICESCAQSDIQYTYFHDSLGRHSVIDHVFVDKSICGNVIKYETIDSGVNLSDHVPVG